MSITSYEILVEELRKAAVKQRLCEPGHELSESQLLMMVIDWGVLTDGLRKDLAEAQKTIDALSNSVRFLSDMSTKWHQCRSEAIQLRGEDAREHLKMKWPVIQGLHNNQTIVQVGKQPWDGESARLGFEYLSDGQ